MWYFHIKSSKQEVWGATTHFLLRIDTAPPAAFTPTIETLTAQIIGRVLISFFTTDALSGINHYEVGVVEKDKSSLGSPLFVQADSPYQVPSSVSNNLRVVVRALDNAGNVRDESIDINLPSLFSFLSYIKDHLINILIFTLAFIVLLIILHYLIGHKIISHLRRALKLVKKEEKQEELEALSDNLNTNLNNNLVETEVNNNPNPIIVDNNLIKTEGSENEINNNGINNGGA